MKKTWFDNSLGLLAEAIVETLGAKALRDGVALRDAAGFLSFVSPDTEPTTDRIKVIKVVEEKLGPYARRDGAVLFGDDPGAQRLLKDEDRLYVPAGKYNCWIVDRRIVGSGWLSTPVSEPAKPPRLVFASLKGGVGRSTALAVAASDFAARGRNVLVVDLDLEAPGLGALLLESERVPRFGAIDYLVENGIGGVPDNSIGDFIGISSLTTGGGGRVDVLPAIGHASISRPENILPKLARAMTEDVSVEGQVVSVGRQMSEMIDRFATRESYDCIMVDSRAGLAELSAPAVLCLGALVLLFGTAQQQTIGGYSALFAGLRLLAIRAAALGKRSDWRLLFKPVYAKASLDTAVGERYLAHLYDLFAENLYDEEDAQTLDAINFPIEDPDAPHRPLVIPFDPRFVDFDPLINRSHLANAFYEQTFRPFLSGLDACVAALRDGRPS